MSGVPRYDSYGYDGLSGLMKEHPEGEWVRIESFELAILERDQLRAENARLREALIAASKASSAAEVGLIVDAALAGKGGDV